MDNRVRDLNFSCFTCSKSGQVGPAKESLIKLVAYYAQDHSGFACGRAFVVKRLTVSEPEDSESLFKTPQRAKVRPVLKGEPKACSICFEAKACLRLWREAHRPGRPFHWKTRCTSWVPRLRLITLFYALTLDYRQEKRRRGMRND